MKILNIFKKTTANTKAVKSEVLNKSQLQKVNGGEDVIDLTTTTTEASKVYKPGRPVYGN